MKNYSSILAIVNHRNWLDDSPPLRTSLYECVAEERSKPTELLRTGTSLVIRTETIRENIFFKDRLF